MDFEDKAIEKGNAFFEEREFSKAILEYTKVI